MSGRTTPRAHKPPETCNPCSDCRYSCTTSGGGDRPGPSQCNRACTDWCTCHCPPPLFALRPQLTLRRRCTFLPSGCLAAAQGTTCCRCRCLSCHTAWGLWQSWPLQCPGSSTRGLRAHQGCTTQGRTLSVRARRGVGGGGIHCGTRKFVVCFSVQQCGLSTDPQIFRSSYGRTGGGGPSGNPQLQGRSPAPLAAPTTWLPR